MKKISYHYKSLIVLLVTIFIVIFSCSDNSKDPEEDDDVDTNTDTNTTNLHQPSLLLNSKDKCLVGWDIHPYKECSQESFGIKSYKEQRTKACGVESKTKGCKKF